MTTVRERIAQGVYETQLVYPSFTRKPRLAAGATSKEAREYARLLAEFEEVQDAELAARRAYNRDVDRLEAVFRQDLLAELGVTDHPKASVLWAKAWERGHSGGYSEVLSVAEDLVDLLV